MLIFLFVTIKLYYIKLYHINKINYKMYFFLIKNVTVRYFFALNRDEEQQNV